MSREEITRGPGIEAPEKNIGEAQLKAAERLVDGLGEISDDLILDADPYSPDAAASGYQKAEAAAAGQRKAGTAGRGGRRFSKALPVLAACLCVFLGVSIALRGGIPNFTASKGAENAAEAPQAMESLAQETETADAAEGVTEDDEAAAESSGALLQSLQKDDHLTDSKPAQTAGNTESEERSSETPSDTPVAAFTPQTPVNKADEGKAESSGAAAPDTTYAGTNEPVKQTEVKRKMDMGFGQFETDLVNFIDAAGFRQQNYMLSPASFKAALALAVSGAEGETKEQLLKAAGFDSVEDLNAWYGSLNGSIQRFAQQLDAEKQDFERNKEYMGPDAKGPDGAFEIANSVWHNTDKPGKMKASYKTYVAEHYAAEANEADSASITDRVNGWCDEKTHGMIPVIADDLSEEASVLINALYLRTSWLNRFEEGFTQQEDFTCLDGSVVKKDFMKQRSKYAYYEDENTQLVVIPMNGSINAVFVLGSAEGLKDKMDQAEYCEVIVKLPKFDVDTSFEHQEFVEFLAARGADLPFRQDGSADFSALCEGADWFISDIIQKSKIKLDEDGIEAAAVTAIMVRATSAMPKPEEPREFTADRPFSFALVTGGEAPELLFYGQIVK